MTNPNKCANCPVLLNAEQERTKAENEYSEAFEMCMSDFSELRAAQEFILAREMGAESEYFGQSEQEIAEDIRAEIVEDMNEAEADITDFRQQMGRYAANCDGAVTMSVVLGDGLKFEAVVCGSRETKESEALEPAEVRRTYTNQN